MQAVLLKSKLDYETLGKVWNLSDIDQDGYLDVDEFAVAMHLCHMVCCGACGAAAALAADGSSWTRLRSHVCIPFAFHRPHVLSTLRCLQAMDEGVVLGDKLDPLLIPPSKRSVSHGCLAVLAQHS